MPICNQIVWSTFLLCHFSMRESTSSTPKLWFAPNCFESFALNAHSGCKLKQSCTCMIYIILFFFFTKTNQQCVKIAWQKAGEEWNKIGRWSPPHCYTWHAQSTGYIQYVLWRARGTCKLQDKNPFSEYFDPHKNVTWERHIFYKKPAARWDHWPLLRSLK